MTKLYKSDLGLDQCLRLFPVRNSLMQPVIERIFLLPFFVLFKLFLPDGSLKIICSLYYFVKYHSSQLFDDIIDYSLRK